MASSRVILYINLHSMLNAGIPILRSLRTVASGAGGKRAKTFLEVAEIICRGESLAKAMAQFPRVFAPLEVLIIEAGETSGYLAEAVKGLADWFEFAERMKRIIITGLALPFFIIHIAAFVVPLPSLIIGKISAFDYFCQVLGVLALFYVPGAIIGGVIRFTPKTGFLRRMLDGLLMGLPVVRRAVLRLALSRYCRTFNQLLKAGVPTIQCAEEATAVTGNNVVSKLVAGVSRSAREGKMLSEGFARQLPAEFRESWKIGEETGDLDKVTDRLAVSNSQSAELIFTELSIWLPRIVYFLVMLYLVYQILQLAPAAFSVSSAGRLLP